MQKSKAEISRRRKLCSPRREGIDEPPRNSHRIIVGSRFSVVVGTELVFVLDHFGNASLIQC